VLFVVVIVESKRFDGSGRVVSDEGGVGAGRGGFENVEEFVEQIVLWTNLCGM
jgi:hypothetical protein